MPSLIMKRGKKRYRGSVPDPVGPGKRRQKLFPDGTRKSFLAAARWEEGKAAELRKNLEDPIDMDCLTVYDWAQAYLDDIKERCVTKTYKEKQAVMKRFVQYAGKDMPAQDLDIPSAALFLIQQKKIRSGNAANKDRKNLAVAWSWGREYIRDFPSKLQNPFLNIKRFPEKRAPRYIPPIEDFWKAYDLAQGQDKVMLLAFLHTAARRGEIFRMKMTDCDFKNDRIRLWTKKREAGDMEYDWLPMTAELRAVLLSWIEQRMAQPTIDHQHVFVCLNQSPFCDEYYGKPFKTRQHWLRRLCDRADVPPFGLHAIRHLSAVELFQKGYGVAFVQQLLRHRSPNTTERYLKRAMGHEHLRRKLEEGFNRNNVIDLQKEKASGAGTSEG